MVTTKEPVLPSLEVPVVSDMAPLTPRFPAFVVAITTSPLEVPTLYPVFTVIEPPFAAAALPPTMVTAPP